MLSKLAQHARHESEKGRRNGAIAPTAFKNQLRANDWCAPNLNAHREMSSVWLAAELSASLARQVEGQLYLLTKRKRVCRASDVRWA